MSPSLPFQASTKPASRSWKRTDRTLWGRRGARSSQDNPGAGTSRNSQAQGRPLQWVPDWESEPSVAGATHRGGSDSPAVATSLLEPLGRRMRGEENVERAGVLRCDVQRAGPAMKPRHPSRVFVNHIRQIEPNNRANRIRHFEPTRMDLTTIVL
jgi:hypothetical protein